MSNRHCSIISFAIAVSAALVASQSALGGQDGTVAAAGIRTAVETDWDRQEERLDRAVSSPEAIHARLISAERLLAGLSQRTDAPDLEQERTALAKLRARATLVDELAGPARTKLYRDIRWVTRGMALKNPLVAGKRILFMKRKRFICQMLHEYLGYYYDYEDIAGGGIYLLEQPGYSFTH
ncbi:MAG: hypothetical protein JSW59_14510, partial [Phycisphaerales bacterium]